jgi:hypothetical protein
LTLGWGGEGGGEGGEDGRGDANGRDLELLRSEWIGSLKLCSDRARILFQSERRPAREQVIRD